MIEYKKHETGLLLAKHKSDARCDILRLFGSGRIDGNEKGYMLSKIDFIYTEARFLLMTESPHFDESHITALETAAYDLEREVIKFRK